MYPSYYVWWDTTSGFQDPLKPRSSRIATFSAISASPMAPKIAKKAVSTAVLRVQNRCIWAYFGPIFRPILGLKMAQKGPKTPVLPHKKAANTAFFSEKYPYFGSFFQELIWKIVRWLGEKKILRYAVQTKKIINIYDVYYLFLLTQCNKPSIQNCNISNEKNP